MPRTFSFPPSGDGMRGKCRSVMGDADGNHAAVEHRVVDPIGESHTVGIGEEIVIVDLDRRAVLFGAGLLEVADHLPLLAIHTDNCGITSEMRRRVRVSSPESVTIFHDTCRHISTNPFRCT